MLRRKRTSESIGVKVFTASTPSERPRLGDTVTQWLRDNPELTIDDLVTRQSSSRSHHCLSLVFFYRLRGGR